MDKKEANELNDAIFEMFGKLFPENTTVTMGGFSDNQNVFVEFNDNKWKFTSPLPGVKNNEIKVSFKINGSFLGVQPING